ncbi:hypothetical protein BRX43_03065 [Sphingomonas sp. S-NIH.Pt15_0812]|nr:hypothetical protein BRX43_03065 [Sphingomonas sp. S-NIH.Pt15_0812]
MTFVHAEHGMLSAFLVVKIVTSHCMETKSNFLLVPVSFIFYTEKSYMIIRWIVVDLIVHLLKVRKRLFHRTAVECSGRALIRLARSRLNFIS